MGLVGERRRGERVADRGVAPPDVDGGIGDGLAGLGVDDLDVEGHGDAVFVACDVATHFFARDVCVHFCEMHGVMGVVKWGLT